MYTDGEARRGPRDGRSGPTNGEARTAAKLRHGEARTTAKTRAGEGRTVEKQESSQSRTTAARETIDFEKRGRR
jgi:hypothetical protein